MIYKIVLIKFPFSNLTSFKVRPALKIKNLKGENNIYLQITSKKSYIENYEFEINNKILKVASYVRFDRIITLDKSLEIREISKLSSKESLDFNKKFLNFFS